MIIMRPFLLVIEINETHYNEENEGNYILTMF